MCWVKKLPLHILYCIVCYSRRHGLEDEGEDTWIGEMVTMREILKQFAGVRQADVLGMRAPHLKAGKESHFQVSHNSQFLSFLKFINMMYVYTHH